MPAATNTGVMTTSSPHGSSGDAVALAAERLAVASSTAVPCEPVRDLIAAGDVDAAYAVQEHGVRTRLAAGAVVVGRKIGLTSSAVQQQLGVDQPDFGFLFDDMAHLDQAHVPCGSVLQPRAEAEIAFVLDKDLTEGLLDLPQVRDAIAYAVAAIEICGSRIRGWDITFADTVADNASAGAYVLGATRLTLDEFEPKDTAMRMSVNGETVSTGHGAACLGDPLEAVAWLARTSRDLGQPLQAGQVVLSGALGPMHAVGPGDHVVAVVEPLGSVEFTLSEEQA